jgi:mRNA interferase MazF
VTSLRLRRGDIVLVPFPFTDLTGQKVRPALVISPDPPGEDVMVAFISSVVPPTLEATEAKGRSLRLNRVSPIHDVEG